MIPSVVFYSIIVVPTLGRDSLVLQITGQLFRRSMVIGYPPLIIFHYPLKKNPPQQKENIYIQPSNYHHG
jgi:hypothetical protein